MSEIVEDRTPRKKGGMMKIMVMLVGLLVLVGGGVGAGLYASNAGLLGGGHAGAEAAGPKLVPKSEQKRAAAGEGEGHASGGHAAPAGSGGDKYASNYYAMDKEFTSNLQDSVHFIQVGIAISTPYDDTRHRESEDQRDRGALLDPDGARRHDRGAGDQQRRARSSSSAAW